MPQLPFLNTREKHPLGGKIIFAYGMTKCGSTLSFELARSALEMCGFPQDVLGYDCLGTDRKINFARHLDDKNIAELQYAIRHIGHPIVVKTHTRPDIPVIEMINQGDAIVQATYRDPREMALSMMDHARRSREIGRAAFAEIETLEDARWNIYHQVDSLTQWLYRQNCLPVYYEDIAFRGNKTLKRLLKQMHLDVGPSPIYRYVLKNRFIQLNLGVKRRYREQMTYEDQRLFKRSFRPLYMRMIKHRDFIEDDATPPLRDGTLLISPGAFAQNTLSKQAQSA